MKTQIDSLQNLIETLQSQGQYWFLKENLIKELDMSENAFLKASSRLIKKAKLARIYRGFYVIVPLEYYNSGCLPVSWFIHALMEYLDQPYYVALLTAAGIHGSSHQQAMAFQIITHKPIRKIIAGRLRIEFCYKKNIRNDFYQPIKTASGFMHVSTPEMTAFDLVHYANASGQLQHVTTVLLELAEKLNPEILTSYVKNDEVEIPTAQRLFYLLDLLKIKIDLREAESELKLKKPVKKILVPRNHSPILEYNERWKILVNETLEPDDL